jgi:DNA-binding transcriptional regulator PaaX
MSKSQNDNVKNNPPEVGDIDVSRIDDKAAIYSTSDSARHMERAQEKEVEVTEGNETGSWQINEKVES